MSASFANNAMMPSTRTTQPADQAPQPLMGAAISPAEPALPAPATGMDPRGWIALAAIASGGSGLGFAQGRGWLTSPLAKQVLMGAALITVAASLAALLRRGEASRRITDGIQQFGGGTYGAAAFATWLYQEGVMLARDWAAAGTLEGFLDGRMGEWLIGFSQQSLRNLLDAALWPLFWMRESGPVAAAMVAGCAWLAVNFARARRAPAAK